MTPDEISNAITDDMVNERATALVALADLAYACLNAHAEYRRVGQSDTPVSDEKLAHIINQIARYEILLSRAVGYTQTAPIEEHDDEATQRVADALARLDENHDDPEWMKKTWIKIDRIELERNRWWRRLGRWLGIGK